MSAERLFLCPNCFDAVAAARTTETCGICGHSYVECNPGDPDDPCRKPLMDADGALITRAPQWWIDQYKQQLL